MRTSKQISESSNDTTGSPHFAGTGYSDSTIEIVSCEIINYILQEHYESVFAIIELNTIDAAKMFYQIFNTILFKDTCLKLKPADEGLLIMYDIPPTVDSREIFIYLSSVLPYLKGVSSHPSYEYPLNYNYVMLEFENHNMSCEALNKIKELKSTKEFVSILGKSVSASFADPFANYSNIWKICNTDTLQLSNITHTLSTLTISEKQIPFVYDLFQNKSSVRVYNQKSVVKIKDSLGGYFAPNTTCTLMKFNKNSAALSYKSDGTHQIDEFGRFVLNFTE